MSKRPISATDLQEVLQAAVSAADAYNSLTTRCSSCHAIYTCDGLCVACSYRLCDDDVSNGEDVL